jgi:hypothetical protein
MTIKMIVDECDQILQTLLVLILLLQTAGLVDPAGIRRFGPTHTSSPKPRMFNAYVESGKKRY